MYFYCLDNKCKHSSVVCTDNGYCDIVDGTCKSGAMCLINTDCENKEGYDLLGCIENKCMYEPIGDDEDKIKQFFIDNKIPLSIIGGLIVIAVAFLLIFKNNLGDRL